MSEDFDFNQNGVRVRVEGLSKATRALGKAGADSQDMKVLMHELGMIVVKAASAPVLSGRLSGTIRAGRGKTKAVVRAGGARAPYAGVVHYGWPARNIEPNPFLLNALQRKRGDVFNALDSGLDELLRKNNLK